MASEVSTSAYMTLKNNFCHFSDPLTPGVNFINVKRTNFLYEHHYGSFDNVHVPRKKLPKWCSYRKCASFTLMKLMAVMSNKILLSKTTLFEAYKIRLQTLKKIGKLLIF